MKKSHCLPVILFLLLSGSMFAQNRVITGKVINQSTDEPLQGVNILADKQRGGVTTKLDGTYSITVENNVSTLIFSYVGFAPQSVTIGNKSNIDVSLVPTVAEGSEVVVIGYGTQKKSHLTGAVSKFRSVRLDESPVSRLDQALQGKIAGVQIQNLTSEAGAD